MAFGSEQGKAEVPTSLSITAFSQSVFVKVTQVTLLCFLRHTHVFYTLGFAYSFFPAVPPVTLRDSLKKR
jgi:hypothetical protein